MARWLGWAGAISVVLASAWWVLVQTGVGRGPVPSASRTAEIAPSPLPPQPANSAPLAAAPVASQAPQAPGRAERSRELHWSFEQGPFGPTDVVISVPTSDGSARFPVLVALHGRGESRKGRRRGARGWLDDYQLGRAISRLAAPPLLESDFEQFITSDRLARLNQGLAEHPYAGLIIVCPFLPDVLKGESAFRQAAPLARFVVDVLLPRVYAETPALGTAASTGIDGVSLGGRAALLVGLTRPLAFGSVSGLQAALDAKELDRFAELAARALGQNPRLSLRLLTSDDDHFLDVNEQLSVMLGGRSVRHELTRVVGTHSYRFNRGPGSLEMLIFHNRVLRGWPSP